MSDSTFRVARLHDAGDLRIEHLPPPTIPAGHVAIRPRYCGICGSDLHMFFHQALADALKDPHPVTGDKLPNPFGHEFSGTISEIGPDCSTDLKPGNPVAVMPVIYDNSCTACSLGAPNVCANVGFIGYNSALAGGMSDLAIVPVDAVFPLPAAIGLDVGALIEPLAVAWHAISHIRPYITTSSPILIIGGGPVGCAVLLALHAHGLSNISISEPSPEKRQFCTDLGATHVLDPSTLTPHISTLTSGAGVDAVFDCAGVGSTLSTAVECVRTLGTIVNLAIQFSAQIPLLAMVKKEVVLKCSLAYTAKDFREVIEAVADGRLKPERMITKRIRLERVVEEGLEVLHDRENEECKILVDLGM